jgi:hypothetical protein
MFVIRVGDVRDALDALKKHCPESEKLVDLLKNRLFEQIIEVEGDGCSLSQESQCWWS